MNEAGGPLTSERWRSRVDREGLAEHEDAARQVAHLRRKGVLCHLESWSQAGRGHARVVLDRVSRPKPPRG